jgi:hypothetical protein
VTLTKGYADFGSAVVAPSLSLDNTTVQDNRGAGSALAAQNSLRIVNSTISRNVVGKPAVEYGSLAQVTIDNSTIAYNAPAAGLGPSGYPGAYMQVTLRNSILANNGSPLQNCATYAGFVYQGTNVVNDWSCADVAITPSDPQLMPLARNGGPNMTHAIPHTSPAYNTGVNCSQTTDQRYVARDAKCDVGAFEFNDLTKVTITIDPTVRLDTGLGYGLLTGHDEVHARRDDPAGARAAPGSEGGQGSSSTSTRPPRRRSPAARPRRRGRGRCSCRRDLAGWSRAGDGDHIQHGGVGRASRGVRRGQAHDRAQVNAFLTNRRRSRTAATRIRLIEHQHRARRSASVFREFRASPSTTDVARFTPIFDAMSSAHLPALFRCSAMALRSPFAAAASALATVRHGDVLAPPWSPCRASPSGDAPAPARAR